MYITGGGCSGFQYGFTFDDQINEGDMTIEKQGVGPVVDPMSLQYLVGGAVDYTEGPEGSRFIVTNPNAKKHLRLRLLVQRLTQANPALSHKESGKHEKNGNLKVTVLFL